jgi:hypothetical protein
VLYTKNIKVFIDDLYLSYELDLTHKNVVERMHQQLERIEKGVNIKLSKKYRLKEKKTG